jgi:LPS-assembly protein
MYRLSLIVVLCLAGFPGAGYAQSDLAGCKASQALYKTATNIGEDRNHIVFDGTLDSPVQIDCDESQFFADHAEYFKNEGRVTAQGHVVYVSGGSRISAERMEFNTKTRTGTFYVADGTAVLRETADPSLFGGQVPDMMFRGDEIHKLGPKKYRIVHGAFTTCVQPTPRWEMVSGTITLTLDDYAFLTNTIFKVKNVPVMYLPAFYYPIPEDERATGFVMPIYGTSTVRGQSISNAFFWAIGRSHDATIYHDWFSKTGQQVGGEYEYVAAPGSQGLAKMSILNEHEATYQQSSGSATTTAAQKSYAVRGNMTQRLPRGFSARGNADYFSSITTKQKYQQDIYQATNRTRHFGGNLTGVWGAQSISVTAERNELFTNDTSFTTNGTLPRVTVTRSEHPIAGSPIYFGVGGDFVTIQRSNTSGDVKSQDQGLTKFEVNPTVRVPFTRWPFLTINSSVSWRGTYWTESLDETTTPKTQVPEPIGREYFDFQTRLTGPVFNRIWNTPGNGYAQKFKHVIEPSVSIQRTTAIDNFDRIVQLEGSDYVVGNVTSLRYALANRLYAKKTTSREILSATVSQSYYTDERAADLDRQYQSSSYAGSRPTHFSPVALQLRGSPTDGISADFRTEWDSTERVLRTLAANGTFNAAWVQATGGWSLKRFIPGLRGFEEASSTHYLNASGNVRRPGSRLGGNYSFSYDLKRDSFLQQRFTAYYNAQCCGVAVEYQSFNLLGSTVGLAVPNDHRFNLSFTLAGIGTFSNLFGAFGGGQGR